MSHLPQLDAIDIAILNQLQRDGRRSFTVIAGELGMSIGAIRNRVARLMEQGTLRIIGKVDPYHVGWNAPATLEIATAPGQQGAVIAALIPHDEVTYIASISGEYNLMVDIMCRDNDDFVRWYSDVLQTIEGIERIKVTMILKIHKYASAELSLDDDSGETP